MSSSQQHSGAAGAPSPVRSNIDTTRVLNLFGYVGPVASLMVHTLYAAHPPSGGSHSSASSSSAGGAAPPRSAHIQRIPSIGTMQARRRSSSGGGGASSGYTPSRTRFITTRTEDAIDSVLPCAAERAVCALRRPGKFGNPSNLRFEYALLD